MSTPEGLNRHEFVSRDSMFINYGDPTNYIYQINPIKLRKRFILAVGHLMNDPREFLDTFNISFNVDSALYYKDNIESIYEAFKQFDNKQTTSVTVSRSNNEPVSVPLSHVINTQTKTDLQIVALPFPHAVSANETEVTLETGKYWEPYQVYFAAVPFITNPYSQEALKSYYSYGLDVSIDECFEQSDAFSNPPSGIPHRIFPRMTAKLEEHILNERTYLYPYTLLNETIYEE